MDRKNKFLLLICDLFLFLGSVCFLAYIRESIQIQRVLGAPGLWFIALTILMLLYIFGSYDINHATTSGRLVRRSSFALLMGLIVVVIVNYFGAKERSGIFGRGILIGSLLSFGFLSAILRGFVAQILGKRFRKSRWLIVATREVAELFREDLQKNPFQGQIFFLLESERLDDEKNVLGDWSRLSEVISKKWTAVVVAVGESAPADLIEKLMLARFEANNIRDLVQFYEEYWHKVPLYYLGSRWFLLAEGFNLLGNPIRLRIKRMMDVGISFVILVLTSPMMILAAIAIRLESKGHVIYSQVRTGKDGREFVIHKFRSMRSDAEKDGAKWASLNDSRITKVGNFIRKTRIDELPQLVNILEGSMSFIGPRPERPEFNQSLEKELSFYNLRHMVHPGLTGWAQILYPYGASVEDAKEKLQYDLYYIKNYSFWLDVSIVLKTITVVIFGRGR